MNEIIDSIKDTSRRKVNPYFGLNGKCPSCNYFQTCTMKEYLKKRQILLGFVSLICSIIVIGISLPDWKLGVVIALVFSSLAALIIMCPCFIRWLKTLSVGVSNRPTIWEIEVCDEHRFKEYGTKTPGKERHQKAQLLNEYLWDGKNTLYLLEKIRSSR